MVMQAYPCTFSGKAVSNYWRFLRDGSWESAARPVGLVEHYHVDIRIACCRIWCTGHLAACWYLKDQPRSFHLSTARSISSLKRLLRLCLCSRTIKRPYTILTLNARRSHAMTEPIVVMNLNPRWKHFELHSVCVPTFHVIPQFPP